MYILRRNLLLGTDLRQRLGKSGPFVKPQDFPFLVRRPWLFPNENMGLNLPFAVGLVFIKLNGTSGQHGRFLASYQGGFKARGHVSVGPNLQNLYKLKLVISDARASFGKEVAYRSRARDGRCAGRH
jgi:hypothetical protein